jgi:hypothetical protein
MNANTRDGFRRLTTGVLGAALTVALAACTRSEAAEPGTRTLYGEAVAIGNGAARAYVTMQDDVPLEIGVALGEAALDGLPSHHHPGGLTENGHTTFASVLRLPAGNPTPFQHILMNWNPGGHEPPGIYDLPHLDLHFYTITDAERRAIDPADPNYRRKAERAPSPERIPAGYVLPEPLPFAQMGVHWVDPESPELNGETFTSTFIFGSWDGRLIFAEPMITKAFLESKPDFTAAVPLALAYEVPGHYPTRYSVRWDAEAREYRIALTGLVPRG